MTDITRLLKAQEEIRTYKEAVTYRLRDLTRYYEDIYPKTCEEIFTKHETNIHNLNTSYIPLLNHNPVSAFKKAKFPVNITHINLRDKGLLIKVNWYKQDSTGMLYIPYSIIEKSLEDAIAEINAQILQDCDISIDTTTVYTQPGELDVIGQIVCINNEDFILIGTRLGRGTWMKIINEPRDAIYTMNQDPEQDTKFSWSDLCQRGQIKIVS